MNPKKKFADFLRFGRKKIICKNTPTKKIKNAYKNNRMLVCC